MIWALFAVMALVALMLASMPLWWQPHKAAEADRLSVYGRQLAEIDGEAARGLLTADAAAAARLEIERRILRLDGAAPRISPPGKSATGLIVLGAVAAVLLAGGLYLWIGHPEMPDQPARHGEDISLNTGDGSGPDLNDLLDRLIAFLDKNPEAMEGWAHLRRAAPALGREADLAAALERAVKARPQNVELRVIYAESLILMGQGQVTPAAQLALAEAAKIDPTYPAIRYYDGLALLQANKPAEAEALWQALLDEAPPNAAWREQLSGKIAEAEAAQGKGDAASAIAALPADQQMQQIRAMVEGLAARLEAAPDDSEGWLRLGRAWRVLKEPEKAAAALERGRALAEKAGDNGLVADFDREKAALGSP